MSRPLDHPEEGPRRRLEVHLTAPIRARLELIRQREELASLSSTVDWLIRRHPASKASTN